MANAHPMINGRPMHPYLRIALVVIVGYLIVTQLLRFALLPVAVALVGWIVYAIARAEIGRRPRRPAPAAKRKLRVVEAVRIDPSVDLRVPKDWR